MIKKLTLMVALLCAHAFAFAVNYLTFTAEEDNSSFYPELKAYFEENTGFADNPPSIQYSLDDGQTWTEFQFPKDEPVVLAKKGDKAMLRGQNDRGISPQYGHYVQFVMTGAIAASGSVNTLVDTTKELEIAPTFNYLFKDCTSLTKAPDLPSTIVDFECYKQMFSGCTNLTQAPELPATELSVGCYYGMFNGCASLTKAPKILPAKIGEMSCYDNMFEGCTSLTKAPELFAAALPGYDHNAYMNIFSGCTNLSEITVHFTEWPDTYSWVADVAPTGTFICPKELPLEYGANRIPKGWAVKHLEETSNGNYLTFTAWEDYSSFGIVNKDNNVDVQYSLDNGETWQALSEGETISLPYKGDMAILRGDNPDGFSRGKDNYTYFTMKGRIVASGSVMSLIDNKGDSKVIPCDWCFYNLFTECSSLIKAPRLPATKLTEWCYLGMFSYCENLDKAPELPATELSKGCYYTMFFGCKRLSKVPELPATDLAVGCYGAMFGYTALAKAPALPATELPIYCYVLMFKGCTNLTQAPELPATELSDGCYYGMFKGCASLTQAPELPATDILVDSCYVDMFYGCKKLSQLKVNFTTWTSETKTWVEGVASNGTFICPRALAEEYGEDRIPTGWKVQYIDGEDDDVGAVDVAAENCSVWTEDLFLFVRGVVGRIEVYDLNGKLLRSTQSKENETVRFVLPGKGTYVVRTEAKNVKILN
ncbi:MAG: leucine-rich repeat protein [Paludibacteraceae bacterium]|nr:leucine-rich repeat protein [Paludibacteraceae bacterium]